VLTLLQHLLQVQPTLQPQQQQVQLPQQQAQQLLLTQSQLLQPMLLLLPHQKPMH